jgi:hypothetical protein
MKSIQIAVLAVPAAIAGIAGGIGLASAPDPESRVAALWGKSRLVPLESGSVTESWDKENKRREAEMLKLNERIADADLKQQEAENSLAALQAKRDAVTKLRESLETLEKETRPEEQERITTLAGWATKTKECLATIPMDGRQDPGDLKFMEEWRSALATAKPIDPSLHFREKQKELAIARDALKEVENAIDARRAQLLSEQDQLLKRLAELDEDYRKANPTP